MMATSTPLQLQPLVDALPRLEVATYRLALRSASLHLQGRDEDIDASSLERSLGQDVGPTGITQVLLSTLRLCHLLDPLTCILLASVLPPGYSLLRRSCSRVDTYSSKQVKVEVWRWRQ